jgi:hypothetical protein
MKFDTARAATTFGALGDPCFTGADGESRVAEYVMNELGAVGWTVERREVSGSPWPQRLAPWVRWLGFGGVLTAIVAVPTQADSFWLTVGVLPLIVASGMWLCAVSPFQARLGARRSHMENAPLLIGSLPIGSRAPARVVFQAILGGLSPDYCRMKHRNWFIIFSLVAAPVLIGILAVTGRTRALGYAWLFASVSWALLALSWAVIFWILLRDRWWARSVGRSYQADRRGLAVLLEMARTWRRTGPRQIEAIFTAAGGQRQDFAGSRDVIRLLGTKWRDKPTLLVLFIAPGAGETLAVCTRAHATSQARQLAEDAAASLWLPFRRLWCWDLALYWPLKNRQPAVVLSGSNPQEYFGPTVDQNALQRTAQLATEIALRWAKAQQVELSEAITRHSPSRTSVTRETP